MNKKGFTLVELLAMLVVLGILLGITIPNITGILKRNKENAYFDDASRMYDAVKVKETIKKDLKPTEREGDCTLIHLSNLDTNDDFKKGPNGGPYDKEQSFVIIKLDSKDANNVYKYSYYVRLVEDVNGKKSGVDLHSKDSVDKKDYTIINKDMNSITFSSNDNTNQTNITDYLDYSICEGIKTYNS